MTKLNKEAITGPKRVLHVIQRMRPGGVQTAVMNLYRNIDRTKVQFDFAVRAQQQEYYDEEIKALGGRIFQLPWNQGNPLSVPTYKKALKNLIAEKGPFTAIHSHAGLYSGHILPVAAQTNIPLRLAHSHSALSDKSSILRNIWAYFMRRNIRKYATHMLACSNLASEWLYGIALHADKRISKFPNALDLTSYSNLTNNPLQLRKKINLPLDGPLIGHVGRFDAVKNHAYLLKVFINIRKIYPNAHLVLVGEGNLKNTIIELVEKYGLAEAVIFLGVRNDIPQILGALDILLLPSLHEGFGIVLVEAQAAGTPCLASDHISPEIDLGLNLVSFVPLSKNVTLWVNESKKMLTKTRIPWENRKTALESSGYDIQHTTKLLQNLYLPGQ